MEVEGCATPNIRVVWSRDRYLAMNRSCFGVLSPTQKQSGFASAT